MTSDRPSKPVPRYSRFSRSKYEEVLPPQPPEELSLTEIAMRTLNGQSGASGSDKPRDYGKRDEEQHEPLWDQPPPPEPTTFWSDNRTEPPARAGHANLSNGPERGSEQQTHQSSTPVEPPGAELPRKTEAVSETRDKLLERTAAPAPGMLKRIKADVLTSKLRRPAKTTDAANVEKKLSVFAKTAHAVRTKTAPALLGGASWLARNLQRREIRKRYARLLVLGHANIADRKLEKLFFVPTRKFEQINPAPERGIHYDGPVPAAVFDWIMRMVPSDLRQFAFIDIRAGRGRTALLAAKRNFNRVTAYEWDVPTFDDLEMNVAQYPRSQMVCRNIDCCRGDVDGISLPDQPCIIYFSGAWREQLIAGVMNYVRDTYRQSPRRIYIVLENADDQTAIASDTIFDRIEPPLADRLKLKILSPMDFKVYRSQV